MQTLTAFTPQSVLDTQCDNLVSQVTQTDSSLNGGETKTISKESSAKTGKKELLQVSCRVGIPENYNIRLIGLPGLSGVGGSKPFLES